MDEGARRDEPDRLPSVLVSFCNRPQRRVSLGVVEPETLRYRELELEGGPSAAGITGLASAQDYLFAVAQDPGSPPRAKLLALDPETLAVVAQSTFEVALDVHSIWCTDGVLYAVSTGTDEVIRVELDGPRIAEERCFWRPPGATERVDGSHLNGIVGVNGGLRVSGFGAREGERWASARKGAIWNTADNGVVTGNVFHPHSVGYIDDALTYCASAAQTVQLVGGGASRRLPGYTRGLCSVGDALFVGTSKARNLPPGTKILSRLSRRRAAGKCSIVRLRRDGLALDGYVDVGDRADEIYDLLPVSLPPAVLERAVPHAARPKRLR